MKIKLLKSVKHNGSWNTPGAVIDINDADARTLVRKRAAEEISDELKSALGNGGEGALEILCEIDGVNDDIATKLVEAGFDSLESIVEADRADLIKIKGIGKKSVDKIQESADDLLSEE